MQKIFFSSLVAAGIGALLMISPSLARASSAHSTFKKMRAAVLASAKQTTPFQIKIGNEQTGLPQAWVVENGNLVEVQPGQTFHSKQSGADVTVLSSLSGSDLSKLPPDVRKAVEDAMAKALAAGDGGVGVHATVNGKPTDIGEVKKILKQQGIDFDIKIDLNEDDYESIGYGGDQHTLVLLPKKDPSRRSVVKLNPKSNLPTSLTLQRWVNGKWIDERVSSAPMG